MGSGGLCEASIPLCYNGSTREGGNERRKIDNLCVMIDERALEDFIPFYIYSCLYRFGSDETRTSELLHSTQSRETGAMFCCNCV